MVAQAVGLDAFPFHVHFDVLGVIAGLVVGYFYGLRRLAARYAPPGEPPVTRRQIVWFSTGILLFALVETWPIHDIGEGSLYSFHMVEHLVLALIVPPALLKGTPSWLLQVVLRPLMPLLRVATRPMMALVAFNAVLALMHAPVIVEAMLSSEPVHFLLHAALIGTATLMWFPVLGPVPDLPRLTPLMSMGYLFLQSLIPTIPASFLTFADEPVFPVYEALPRLWGLSVLDDQLIAGLIMKIGGGAVLWTAITVIFFKWAFEEERASSIRRTEMSSR